MNPLMALLMMFLHHAMKSAPQNGRKRPLQAPGAASQVGPGIQAAQGPRGRSAAFFGPKSAGSGGLAGLLNAQGALPHQQPGYTPSASGISSSGRR